MCSPVHVGDPAAIGILDLDKPDFGDSVILKHGEVSLYSFTCSSCSQIPDAQIPVFWACGVTPQVALVQAKLPLAITHKPGHMFVSDVLNRELRG